MELLNLTGCNSGGAKYSKSNCPLDIGMNQPTCTSVHIAFQKWTKTNGCTSTSVIETYTCWTGNECQAYTELCVWINECQAYTELCVWTNEGHSWGWGFPVLS